MSLEALPDELLHRYVDRQLDTHGMEEIRLRLAASPEEARIVQDYETQTGAMHAAFDMVLSEPIPMRFGYHRAPLSWFHAVAGGVLCLLLGTALGWWLKGVNAIDRPELARQAAVAHAVYTPEIRHPVEVSAKEEAHLVGWLSKRLGANVRAPKLTALGYELLGGRLLPEPGRPSAQFMYQDVKGRRLTLYVSTDVHNRDTAFRYANEGELHVFYWVDQKLGYALSGDLDKNEILRVARAVYEQLNP